MDDKHAYTSDEIDARLRHVPQYLGCFAIDQLPKRLKAGDSLVVNQDRAKGEGTHWMAVANKHGMTAIFDPFGGPCDPRLIALGSASVGKTFANTLQYQPASSSACGALSAYFIDCIQHHDPYVVLYKDLIPSTSKRNPQIALRWMHRQEGGDLTKAGDWRPWHPDRPNQFNKDALALFPRYTGAPTNEDYYAWLKTQPEWATLKRGDISHSAVQRKAREATAQAFKDDAQRATPDEIGRQRHGPAWDTYSAETKRGLAMAPIFKEVGKEVSKKNPLLGAIIPGLADPIITNGLKAIYTFLVEGGVEIARALLKGDPKSALLAIAKKSAPAFMQAFTASRQDPTPLALKLREVAEKIAGHEGKGMYRFGDEKGISAPNKNMRTHLQGRNEAERAVLAAQRAARAPAPAQVGTGSASGYCVRCKSKQTMVGAHNVVAKNGTTMCKGKCSTCDAGMCRIVGKH